MQRCTAFQLSAILAGLAVALTGCSVSQTATPPSPETEPPSSCQPSAETVCLDESVLDRPLAEQAYAAAQRFVEGKATGIEFPDLSPSMYRRTEDGWLFTDTRMTDDGYVGWVAEVTQVAERTWRRLDVEITSERF